jgi:tRNA pseudouridine32 synthase/23S rRNA pseudouridine746 synthase
LSDSIATVFENNDFLVVDKPVHWLTVPGRDPKDARPCALRFLQSERNHQVLPVHRLDFEVSGVVLFAKHKAAQTEATDAFESRKAEKTYQALTAGGPTSIPFEVTWEYLLVRGKKRSFEAPHGRKALTFARCESETDGVFAWTLRPATGRPHQLRLSLARAGYPILGDALYGSDHEFHGIALRAVSLKIEGLIIVQVSGLF